jgi:hypothetical protein
VVEVLLKRHHFEADSFFPKKRHAVVRTDEQARLEITNTK